ncbi:DUF6603 domain-containing protein [Paenibacillus sp. RC84]|uniref:DUF6603 domain-containing protein n=1 Tax=Paenibacillus sp. RC84 TaxID=3156252 RepID=UPI003519D64B
MSFLSDLQTMYEAGSGTLTLDTAKLGPTGEKLRQLTGSGTLTVTGVRTAPVESGGIITFEGAGLQLAGSPARMFFSAKKTASVHGAVYGADSEPVLVLSVFVTPDWRFGDALPWLTNTFWQDLALKPGTDGTSPRWLIAAGKAAEPELNLDMDGAVYFYGALDETKGLLQEADWVIGVGPLAFGPAVLRDTGAPGLSLDLKLPDDGGGLSGLFQAMKVPVDARLVHDPAAASAPSGLEITATIQWNGQPVRITSLILPAGGGIAELSLEGPVDLPSPDDIAHWFGGVSITEYLPPSFESMLASVKIGRLALGIGLGSRSVEYVKATLTALEDKPLTIVPNWVEIGDIEAAVAVRNPFDHPSASYKMSGILDIGGVDLLVSANLVPSPRIPDLSVVVRMEPWSEIDLTMIAAKFGLPTGAYKIAVEEFQMGGSTAGIYFIRAGLAQHPLGTGPNTFVMNNLVFELDYDGQPSFTLEGTMTIAGVDARLSLEAGSGDTSGGTSPGGWNIVVQAGKENPIPMGELLDDLAAKFDVGIPAPIRGMTLKNLELKYASSDSGNSFFFTVESDFKVNSVPVALTLSIRVVSNQTGTGDPAGARYEAFFGGQIVIGSLEFDLLFDRQDLTSQTFIATYSRKSGSPPAVSIRDLVASLSPELAAEIPQSLAIDLRDVKFIFYKDEKESKFALGLDLDAHVSLTDLPLIGKELPADDTIAVQQLQILYASAPFMPVQTAQINKLLPESVHPLPSGVEAGLTAGADLRFGGTPQTLSFALIPGGGQKQPALREPLAAEASGQQQDDPANPDAWASPAAYESVSAPSGGPPVPAFSSASSTSPASSAKWFLVQKTFGPVSISRLGIGYGDGTLWFMLDGSLTSSGLTISLAGMGFGSPLDRFELKFQLLGIGVDYTQAPLEIGGSFMEVVPPPEGARFMYDGAATIRTADFALEALGSYTQMLDGQPSLFVFANVDTPLGGPPALFVTGLSAGFGYNRDVNMPAPEEVFEFPLLALTRDTGPKLSMNDVMAQLEGTQEYAPGKKRAWIRPQTGEYWLAVGVDFWSYELLHTRALLIAKFGRELELALLGLSSIRLPQAGNTMYAYAELQLEADWKPSAGFFGLTALLTPNSFLIDPNCHLTGGFAFYLWYEGEREGQFVVTFGGYHPSFKPPSFYPAVPRIGFNWAVSDYVNIHGEAYFALTPAAVMAGGGLEVLFHDGDLKAWFTARADLLITFHPFHFQAGISVSIGASYRLDLLFVTKTISVELGASVELWGPPTGGKARVHWWVISFTVGFGADRSDGDESPIEWGEFKSLLPSLDNVCKITAVTGLTGSLSPGASGTALKSDSEDAAGSGEGDMAVPPVQTSQPSQSSEPSQLHEAFLPSQPYELSQPSQPSQTSELSDPAGPSPSGPGPDIWLVRAGSFSFTTQTAIPASHFTAGQATNPVTDPKYPEAYPVHIRTMNKTNVSSKHHLTVEKDGLDHDISGWQLVPYYRNMPTALWGEPLKDADGRFMRNPQVPGSDTTRNTPAGLTVTPPGSKLGYSAAGLQADLLAYDDVVPQGRLPFEPGGAANTDYAPVPADTTPGDIAGVMGPSAANRAAIFAALQGMQAYSGTNGPLPRLAEEAGDLFTDSPMQVKP